MSYLRQVHALKELRGARSWPCRVQDGSLTCLCLRQLVELLVLRNRIAWSISFYARLL